MLLTLTIALILLASTWIGRQEIAYSFSGIHISDILSVRVFSVCLFVALAAGLAATPLTSDSLTALTLTDAYMLASAMVITLALLVCCGMRSSAVTAFWGASAALWYGTGQPLIDFPVAACILSLVAAPIFGYGLTFVFQRLLAHYIFERKRHLLVKNLYVKWTAYVGIMLCGIALTYNYALLFDPLLAAVDDQVSDPYFWALMALVCLSCLIAVVLTVIHSTNFSKRMSQHVASLYSLITVLLACNVALATVIPCPVIVSANQVKECNNLLIDRGKIQTHLLNLFSITILTPLLAFIVTTCLLATGDNIYLSAGITLLSLMVCGLIKLFLRQRRKHVLTKQALYEERTHKSEVGNELNRLDLAAVTSQFDSIAKEIDIKHKELISLSLFIRQQRDYLEEFSRRLKAMAAEDDIHTLQRSLRTSADELNENIRLSGEMDHFYTLVEEMHKNFVSRLEMRCPNLSERERRLAILLRLGYSSKEIALLMNVEPKSVEINRYRFRKKLRLDRSVNIVQYLQLL